MAGLRHALSDHSLYKPSFNAFMQTWNHPAFLENEQLLSVDRLAAVAFSIREKELEKMEKEKEKEKEKDVSESDLRESRRQEKRARRERRRNSVLIMMQAQQEEYAATLPRASSTPDIRPRRPEKSKRVAFTLEPFTLPLRYGDAVKPLPPINRPILVKKRKISCLPPSEVPIVDFETFAAWRRGSRMSMDIETQEKRNKHEAAMKAMWEAQRKQKSILANLADAFKACFVHRSARTSPVNWDYTI